MAIEVLALSLFTDVLAVLFWPGERSLAELMASAGSGSSAARLRLVVNGRELATATDPRPLGPVAGVGVIAASISGRTVAGFDDIEVR